MNGSAASFALRSSFKHFVKPEKIRKGAHYKEKETFVSCTDRPPLTISEKIHVRHGVGRHEYKTPDDRPPSILGYSNNLHNCDCLGRHPSDGGADITWRCHPRLRAKRSTVRKETLGLREGLAPCSR